MTQVNSDFPGFPQLSDVPFDATNFGATGSMTWTVGSADQVTYQFAILGSLLFIWLRLLNTTVGGTVASQNLTVKMPNGLKAAKTFAAPFLGSPAGPTEGVIIATTAGSNLLTILRYNANWVAGSDNTDVNGWLVVPIQ